MAGEASGIDVSVRCQARPAAARPGYREDMLCASRANTHVRHRGEDVPVCRMHAATYARWGEDAVRNADESWDWSVRRQPPRPSAALEPVS
jgi:hypothetical protein